MGAARSAPTKGVPVKGPRRLSLRKETLITLAAEDMAAVNGMSGPRCFTITCGPIECTQTVPTVNDCVITSNVVCP